MRQEYIEAFLETVRTRNMTKAAENLHTSQSTVSHHLKALEDELGIQLIMRNKGQRFIELTCQGEEFLPLAENWMRLLDQTDGLRQSVRRELTVASVDSLNLHILYPVCRSVLSRETALSIRIRTDQSRQIYRMAANREIDIGLVSFYAWDSALTVAPFFQQKMCVVRNVFEGSSPICSPDALSAEKEIVLGWGADYQLWHDRIWRKQIRPHITTDSMLLLRSFLGEPGCWAVIPRIELSGLSGLPVEVCEFGADNPPDRIIFRVEPQFPRQSRQAAAALFRSEIERFVSRSTELAPYRPYPQSETP